MGMIMAVGTHSTMESANIVDPDFATYNLAQWAPAMPPSTSMGREEAQTTTPLLVASVMFIIAYQLWKGQPYRANTTGRKVMIAYTLAMGFIELARGLSIIEPIVLPVSSPSHASWCTAVLLHSTKLSCSC
jgi:hypothetical protein